MPQIPRKNRELNDAIEVLDEKFMLCRENIQEAWASLAADELHFIDTEIEKCLDARYYLENYHCIKTENGQLKTFYPFWDHQEIVHEAIEEEFAANGYCLIIILKPRQAGISTWISSRMFHRTIFLPQSFTMLVGQNAETAGHIFGMMENAYHLLPWWLRPEYLYKTKGDYMEFQRGDEIKRMTDPGLASAIQVSNAQKMTGVAIGRTLRNFHGSEVSRWPNADIFTADIEPSMNASDEFGIMESTAFGREGLYYEHWRGSVAGDTGWRPVFIPVYRVTKYSLPTPKNFALTQEEITFNARVKREENVEIPDTFWAWRRRRERAAIASTGGPWAHYESYPITPDEAFQSSGICAFDRSSLAFQSMKNARKPQWVGEISLISVDHNHVNTDLIREVAPNEILPKRKGGKSGERLWIWEMPEAGETYYLGADSALGVVDGDYSVAEVFRVGRGADPDEQVAEWWGWMNPKHFARMLAALGIWYNGAEISSEYQQAGITTGDTLKDLDYPKLYRPQHKDRVAMTLTNYLHWMTTSKTRDQIIVGMNEALLEKSIILHSEDLIDEMRDFSSLGGRFEGQGNHDDGTMASMIALYCLRETAAHLKTDTNTDRQRQQGEVYIWGVYDQFMRQCGQYNTQAEAERVANGTPGWKIQPILVCNANTIFSPIFSANGAESELHSRHGLHSTEITPDVVYAYKSAMRNFSGAEMGDFGDEW